MNSTEDKISPSVDRLKQLLPPPEVAPAPQPWQDVERRLGVALPNDYKEFMEVYGDGTIKDLLLLVSYGESLDASMELRQEDLDAMRLSPEDVFPGGVIEEGKVNLLPWAYTIDCAFCYFWMEPRENPDQWWVVSREREMEWSVFEGSMVEFLVEVVSGRRREPWMPRNFPGDSPWFKTTARYLADTDPYR